MISLDTNGDFSQNYKLLIGAIVPRPIALISTKNEDGSNNLAPFSFFTAVSAQPMIIAFCPMTRTSTVDLKDTPKNIFREKEFTVNFVTEEICHQANLTSTELPYGEDEFSFSKLTPLASEKIKSMRVKESPIHYECIFRDALSYGEDIGQGQIITGEVIKIHVDESLYEDGKINTERYHAVGRGGGLDWIRITDRFQLERLMKAQIQK